ncbi:MAG: ABC transporter permease [Bacteroidia bacterium]|nr:ABC transporter permease [Bacteroidia bacterium]MDW8302721.1 ABC transporter permease subunit [Bacteroidia bacterium]
MFKYILKRILLFIPTLIVISLVSFVISLNAPGDPVEIMMQGSVDAQNTNYEISERQYLQKRHELGLDLPVFYFAVASMAMPDTLYRVHKPNERKMLKKMIAEYGNWQAIHSYFLSLKNLQTAFLKTMPTDEKAQELYTKIQIKMLELKSNYERKYILIHLDTLQNLFKKHPDFLPCLAHLDVLKNKINYVHEHSQKWKNYIPVIHFYGLNNQYHRWLLRFIKGDFGYSYQDKRPIREKIPEALRWSIVISFISIVIAYSISVPLGVHSAVHRNSVSDKIATVAVFTLYSLPPFWTATMLIIFFAGGDYLNWFPASGVQDITHSKDWPLLKRLNDWIWHLFLPIFCVTYTSFAFISRQMRVGMLENIQQDYIRTARAKGLPESKVIWKHAFRNSIIPIITLLGNILPSLVNGSVIIETIFSIPGMGKLSFSAIHARDYPTIVAVFTLSGTLTLVGMLLSDILYALVDPRISYSKK